ncbi:MAG: DUF222 domain-containing protein [Nocardioidaceae bacterium]
MTSSPHPPLSPAGTVAAARAEITALTEQLWAAKTPTDLLAVNLEIEKLRSTLAAVQVRVAVEIEATEAQKADGWASPADYLTRTSGGRQSTGRRLLHTAAALTTAREATMAALTDGMISPEQADVIVACMDLLPVDAELRSLGEKFLLEHAAGLNATELDKLGRELLEVLDPEGVAAREEQKLHRHERSAHLNRFLSFVHDGLGGVRVRGRGTVEDAAIIRTTLDSLAAPAPAGAAEAACGQCTSDGSASGPGVDPDHGLGAKDPRDHGARTWDALVEACQRLTDAQVLPTDHGRKPQLLVHVDWATLKEQVGTATLTTGEHLSAQAVRRLACDAEILPLIMGGPSGVLDAGRSERLVTLALWLALIARDKHCAFPGCQRPPIACDAHHIIHWVDGGPTSIDNLALLCRAHHTIIHATAWQIRLSPADGRPEFKPPPGRHRLEPEAASGLDERDDWIRERHPRA